MMNSHTGHGDQMSTTDLANRLANDLRTPGRIVAEFTEGSDALAYAKRLGDDFTVTAGLEMPFAVREFPKASEPTTADLSRIMNDLKRAVAGDFLPRPMRVRHRGVEISIAGTITQGELTALLALVGYEFYNDGTGAICLRPFGEGEAQRTTNRQARLAWIQSECASLRQSRGS